MNRLLIDCFAGGGGASKGIELALNRPIDIAINHDPEAIRIHKVNHPHTLHLTMAPRKITLKPSACCGVSTRGRLTRSWPRS